MLTTFEDSLLILASIVATITLLFVLQRFWPSVRRQHHNDVIGWQLGVLGTTYAVIVGFMLYAVWTTFQTAELNADSEANSLVSLYRLADGLPAEHRDAVHALVSSYAHTVVDDEWPSMISGQMSGAGRPIVHELWTEIMRSQPGSAAEQITLNLSLTELNNMTERRRARELQSESKLPGILWTVLIFGAAVTIASSCMLGNTNFKLHFTQAVFLTLLLSLTLVAIADIDRPFQGTVHVSDHGFLRAIDAIQRAQNQKPAVR